MMKRFPPLALLIGLLLSQTPAWAQNPFSAARFVNDGIITHYDISQRTRVLGAFGVGPADAEKLALKQLTEDSLKAAAATAMDIFVTEEGDETSVENFVKQRQMSVGGLNARLRNGGVQPETFEYFLRTSLRWREVVNRRFRQRATPSEADVKTELNFAAGRIQESVFIREIAIPFAERGQDGEVQAFAAADFIEDARHPGGREIEARQHDRLQRELDTPEDQADPGIAGKCRHGPRLAVRIGMFALIQLPLDLLDPGGIAFHDGAVRPELHGTHHQPSQTPAPQLDRENPCTQAWQEIPFSGPILRSKRAGPAGWFPWHR